MDKLIALLITYIESHPDKLIELIELAVDHFIEELKKKQALQELTGSSKKSNFVPGNT